MQEMAAFGGGGNQLSPGIDYGSPDDVVFGSQRVDAKSQTPYTDATQVSSLRTHFSIGTKKSNREKERKSGTLFQFQG
jgi:hypothetical protein